MKNRDKIWKAIEYILCLLALIGALMFVFVAMETELSDPDIWLHLKTGQYILEHKAVPIQDPFSAGLSAKEWIDHSWLLQVVFYLIFKSFGADGLILLSALLVLFSFIILFFASYRKRSYFFLASIILIITIFASRIRFNIRPENLSLLFFAIYLFSISRFPAKKYIYILPFVQILWVNCHGFFILGPLLLALLLIGDKLKKERLDKVSYNRLIKVFVFTCAASFINPYGYKGALYPFLVISNSGSNLGIFYTHIHELIPPWRFSLRLIGAYYALMAVSLFSFILNYKRLNYGRLLAWLIFFLISFRVNRNIVFFNFVAFWVTIENAFDYYEHAKYSKFQRIPAHLIYLAKYAILILIAANIFSRSKDLLLKNYYVFEENRFKSTLLGISALGYPAKAADFILENNLPGNIFNFFNHGSYLIYRLYPEKKVFIDGRTELYGKEFFEEYLKMINVDKVALERNLKKYNLNTAVLPVNNTATEDLTPYFYNSPSWTLVYLDDEAIIFIKNTAEYKELAAKLKLDLEKYSVAPIDLNKIPLRRISPYPYVDRGWMLFYLGKNKLALEEAREALKILPSSTEAHNILGRVYLKRNEPNAAFENLRQAYIYAPGYSRTLIGLGEYYLYIKDYKSAIKYSKKLIRLNPKSAEGYSLLAKAYLGDNNRKAALCALEKAIKINPYKTGYYRQLNDIISSIDKSK